MRVDLLSFATASAFFGATHYVNVVEQPARLALDARAMVRESTPRNRRGVAMFASLAMASALLAYVEYIRKRCALALGRDDRARKLALRLFRDDCRKQPVVWNSPDALVPMIRELMRDWGLLEWGQTAIGFAAACIFAWILISPA